MEEYEVVGNFVILYPLEKGGGIDELNLLNDVIRIALEDGHIEVKRIDVREIKKQKK